MHRTGIAALAAASLIALAGCASAAPERDEIEVVATTTQLGDFTREVAGTHAHVTQLLQPGQSAHGFDPSAAALQALASADVLVVNGAGLEEWLDTTLESSGFDGTIVDTSEHVHLHEGGAHDHGEHEHETHADGEQSGDHDEHEHDRDQAHAEESDSGEHYADHDHAEQSDSGEHDADHDHAAHDDAAHDHAEQSDSTEQHADAHAGHDHGPLDPHVWSDPANAVGMVAAIADGLEAADPPHASEYAANAMAYTERLRELESWMRASIEQVPAAERLLVTNHDTFSYLAEAMGIEVVGSVMPSFDDNAEVSSQQIDELVAKIRGTGVRAVFSETSIDPALARTIAAEAGVQVFEGEDALYADALGPAGSPGATYVGSQIHNTQRILTSWGAQALPVPESLA